MKIYVIHHSDDSGMSLGMEYSTSKKDVAVRMKAIEDGGDQAEVIAERELKLNKKDILSFLNSYCAYADNG